MATVALASSIACFASEVTATKKPACQWKSARRRPAPSSASVSVACPCRSAHSGDQIGCDVNPSATSPASRTSPIWVAAIQIGISVRSGGKWLPWNFVQSWR